MIPKQTLENYPVFGDNATKVQPDDAKMAAGFQQSDVLPAEWMNWAWNKNSKGIKDLNLGVNAIEQEIINLLTAAGITPAAATETQITEAVQYLITQKTGTLANLSTTAKSTLVAACNEILAALQTHKADTTNPHAVTKAQVGLGNVENKSTDTAVTQGSTNYVTSGAVFAAIEAISESGSNENGEWLKLKNGLIIQWGVTNVTSSGTAVKQGTVTFPVPFSDQDSYYATVSGNFFTADATPSSTMRCGYVGTNHLSNSQFKYRTQGATSTDTANAVYWLAIGR